MCIRDRYNIKDLNEAHYIDIEKKLLSWVENEMALFITEPKSNNFKPNAYALLKSSTINYATEQLNELLLMTNKDTSAINGDYRGFPIQQIILPDLLSAAFGSLYEPITQNYFTTIDNYVVFANSVSAIQDLINSYISKRTLQEDENYQRYAENLSSESNLFIYSNIARSVNLYEHFSKPEITEGLEAQKEMYQKFEALSIQVSRENNDLFFNNIFLKHNPIYKELATSLWEVSINSKAIAGPNLAKNHYTNANEIVDQK